MSVGTSAQASFRKFAMFAFAMLVSIEVAFHIYYAQFLLYMASRGDVTYLQICGFALAAGLLLASVIAVVLQRKRNILLWSSFVVAIILIFPAIWYNMVASAVLSAIGLIIYRTMKMSNPTFQRTATRPLN